MGRFAAQCEYVVWGTAGPSRDDEEVGCLWGVIREPVRMADKHHVAGKPTAVMQRLVRICPPGGVVLDPFTGSATTGVAALLEGRTFLGVEVAAEYARIANERLGATESQVQLADYRAGQQPLFPRSEALGSQCGATEAWGSAPTKARLLARDHAEAPDLEARAAQLEESRSIAATIAERRGDDDSPRLRPPSGGPT
jgi:hypothetical protein